MNSDGFLTMITRGTGAKDSAEVKRTPLSAFADIRANGIIAFDIEEGDELGWRCELEVTMMSFLLPVKDNPSVSMKAGDFTEVERRVVFELDSRQETLMIKS
jgi:DNA gyrase/topoisomerase IV subunit A